jgi:hypothetical protein
MFLPIGGDDEPDYSELNHSHHLDPVNQTVLGLTINPEDYYYPVYY